MISKGFANDEVADILLQSLFKQRDAMKRNIIVVGVKSNEPMLCSASASIGQKVLKGRMQNANRFIVAPAQHGSESFNSV
jgi:hypothetical protein